MKKRTVFDRLAVGKADLKVPNRNDGENDSSCVASDAKQPEASHFLLKFNNLFLVSHYNLPVTSAAIVLAIVPSG